MEEIIVSNLKYELIEQLKKDGKLVNRVFISFELENTTKKNFKDVRVKILYKTGGRDDSYELAINHVAPEEKYTYGYEQYLTKEIVELSSEIKYEENKNKDKKEFEVYKFSKDKGLLFKIVNKTGKDINYVRVYIEFLKKEKAFTGTNILLSAVKANEEREVEFILPETFKCDNYVLKVDYSDDGIISVYQFGKKYVEVMQEYMVATNIEGKVLDMGNQANNLTNSIKYYENYKPVSFWKSLWEAIKDTLYTILISLFGGISFFFTIIIPLLIISAILEAIKIPAIKYVSLVFAILILAAPVMVLLSIIIKTIKTMRSNLSKKTVKSKINSLYDSLDLLEKDLTRTNERMLKAVATLEDLEFRNPQYELPPLNTISQLFLTSLTKAIEETDISWDEVMRVTKEKYYEAYEQAQKEIARIQGEIKEAEKQEEERNREIQRRFEEDKFRKQLLSEQRAANYARQSEMEKQTRAMEKSNNDYWEKTQRQTDALNAIYRDRYYNN